MIKFSQTMTPVMPLKDTVIFPGITIPLVVGREISLRALENPVIINNEEHIILVTQKNDQVDVPVIDDLYDIGVLAKIVQKTQLSNNSFKVLADGMHRVKLNFKKEEVKDFILADYDIINDENTQKLDDTIIALSDLMHEFAEYIKINKKLNPDIIKGLADYKNPGIISNIIASHLTCKLEFKQRILETQNIYERLLEVKHIIESEKHAFKVGQEVTNRVKKQIEKTQRDYYLNEQMKAIQKELSDGDEKTDITDFEDKIKTLKLSDEAKEKAESDLKKLKAMNPMAAEASVLRNYLDVLLNLPWGKFDKSNVDIKKADKILKRDHYGLEKIKERILEYLAVLQRSKKLSSPIICFVGPPGVGKTSLAKSIAEAVGRKYNKFALGGVRDEAEIRGHRKTYLGSMPGKIISLIKKSKTSNPLILLDEIDKIDSDFRGDPSSALLEVLDPEQNSAFVDHYLEVSYDLSNVMFIATANSLKIPRALQDRMEIIRIAGYVEQEKMEIAKNYLIPKQRKLHGLKQKEWYITDDALLDMIRYYTKEAGVRNLEREIGALARKSLKKILENKEITTITVTPERLEEFLGVEKYRYNEAEKENSVGVTTGLAFTEVGGDLLSIEAVSIPGKGEIKMTGKLGDVMKESTQTAFSYFCSQSQKYGVTHADYKELDIHLHVPEAAIPKDGPSAGAAIFTTIVSLMTNNPVYHDIAMTGEITLRGKILPIGGLKEKLLAANRGGIKKVLIPKDNEKDLKDVPDSVKSGLNIIAVSSASEVLSHALVNKF